YFTQPERHTHHGTPEDAYAALVDGWWADRTAGHSTVMLAAQNRDVEALNSVARHHLREARQLHGPDITINGAQYAIGDEIMCLVNDRRLGVLNGTTARIDAIDPRSEFVHATTSHGDAITLPATYVLGGGITHA